MSELLKTIMLQHIVEQIRFNVQNKHEAGKCNPCSTIAKVKGTDHKAVISSSGLRSIPAYPKQVAQLSPIQ